VGQGYTLRDNFMDDELVLLTSYFNLVDGRSQDTAGNFRVDTEIPSASSPDGSAALYIVTESSASGHVGPRARRLAADTIAWEYSSHGDEPPAVRLKSALRSAHEEILREFEGHVAVGATVMAVERDSVYLAQVAPSQVYVLHDGHLNSLPAPADGDSQFARSLGSRTAPKIAVARDQVAHGDVIALCSSWFDTAADPEDLRESFSAGTSEEIAESLFQLAERDGVRDATAIVVEAALSGETEIVPRGDQAPGFMEQVDIAVQALASVGRMLWHELQPASSNGRGERAETPRDGGRRGDTGQDTKEVPLVSREEPETTAPLPRRQSSTAVAEPETEPVVDPVERVPAVEQAPAVEEPTEPVPRGEPEAEIRPEPELEPPPRTSRLPREDITEEVPRIAPPPRHPIRRPDRRSRPEREPEPEPAKSEAESELEQVNSRLQSGPDMEDIVPPVQAFEDTGVEPARIYATNKEVQAANRRPRRFGGATSVPVIRPGLSDVDLRQPVARPTPPALVWGSIAALLVVAVIAGVIAYEKLAGHKAHSNPYIALVATDLKKARSATTAANQDYYLGKARHNITLAQQNGASPAWVSAQRAKLRTTSDALHHVTRESLATLLTDFSKFAGSNPSQIAVAPGIVYVADPGRKALLSVEAKPGANPVEVAQAGDVYNGFTMSVPKYVAVDGSIALTLDDKNVLVRDNAGNKSAVSLPQQAQKAATFVAMSTSDPDVYLLDTANSQVWRYPYAVSSFSPSPAAYWDANPPNLSDGVSLAFGKALLYILKANGTILKFDFQSNPLKFTVNLRTPLTSPVALYTDPAQHWIWVADPQHKRIVQLDPEGGYSRTYVSSTSSMDFSKIRSIAVGPDGNTIYVLTGTKLFDFPVVS
jgi:hypothetical protein